MRLQGMEEKSGEGEGEKGKGVQFSLSTEEYGEGLSIIGCHSMKCRGCDVKAVGFVMYA